MKISFLKVSYVLGSLISLGPYNKGIFSSFEKFFQGSHHILQLIFLATILECLFQMLMSLFLLVYKQIDYSSFLTFSFSNLDYTCSLSLSLLFDMKFDRTHKNYIRNFLRSISKKTMLFVYLIFNRIFVFYIFFSH